MKDNIDYLIDLSRDLSQDSRIYSSDTQDRIN